MKPIYCKYCGELLENRCDCLRELSEAEADFIEDYENDPMVNYGWHQQDIIDMRRFHQ